MSEVIRVGSEPHRFVFKITGTPHANLFTAVLLCTGIIGITVSWLLVFLGPLQSSKAILGSAFLVFFVSFFTAVLWFSRGTAEMSDDGLIIKAFIATDRYRWTQVQTVERVPSGTNDTENKSPKASSGTIKIILNRSRRLGFGRSTQNPGIPTVINKIALIQVKNPEEFLTKALTLLNSAQG